MIAAVSLTYDKKRDIFTFDDVLKEIKELFGIQNYRPAYIQKSFKYFLRNTDILEKVGEDRFRLHPQYKSEIDKKLQKQQVKEM
jgi:endonuclease IV